jgi:hypothetical protein
MTKIICGVTSCYLNKEKSCCADCIDVSGEGAKSRGFTNCETFGRDNGGFKSSTRDAKEQSDISCNADTCVHNEGNKCLSQTIQIHGSSADKSDETFCTTFRLK